MTAFSGDSEMQGGGEGFMLFFLESSSLMKEILPYLLAILPL